jgi:hypothetical protein
MDAYVSHLFLPLPKGHSDLPGVAHLPSISPLLYVGNERAAAFNKHSYDTVISTTTPVSLTGDPDPNLSTHAVLFDDTEDAASQTPEAAREHFLEGARLVDAAVKAGKRVLVHCEWGQNRSCAVCCAYAVLFAGWSADDAVAYVRERNLADRLYEGQGRDGDSGGAMHNKLFVDLIVGLA